MSKVNLRAGRRKVSLCVCVCVCVCLLGQRFKFRCLPLSVFHCVFLQVPCDVSPRACFGRFASQLKASPKVPNSFDDMFRFSAAVMGFAASVWMNPVLEQFDNIVTNVANSHRLQEECDVLSLILAKERVEFAATDHVQAHAQKPERIPEAKAESARRQEQTKFPGIICQDWTIAATSVGKLNCPHGLKPHPRCAFFGMTSAAYHFGQQVVFMSRFSCNSEEQGPINFSEFKAVMLASLRSLVPKDGRGRESRVYSQTGSPNNLVSLASPPETCTLQTKKTASFENS